MLMRSRRWCCLLSGQSNAVRPLEEYNLAARITADNFTIGDYRLAGLDTSMFWRDRQLTIERLKFADFGGASGEFAGSLAGSFAAPIGQIAGELSAGSASGLFVFADQLSGGIRSFAALAPTVRPLMTWPQTSS